MPYCIYLRNAYCSSLLNKTSFASVSSEITYNIQKEGFDYLDAPIRRITSADAPLHYAPNLVALALPDVARTVKLVKEVMYLKK